MALAFAPASKQPRFAKVLLIGNAGKGKTQAALSFPSPVVIDTEGGTGWFADKFAFNVAHTKSVKEVKKLLDDVQRGAVKCETIIIDSLTSLHNTLLSAGGQHTKDGALSMREWGVLKKEERMLMDRLYLLPFHVVCTGWLKEEYAKPGDTVGGKTVGQNDLVKIGETIDFDKKALHAFDFIFKMDTAEDKTFFATCVKARGDRFKFGQRIANFSWSAIEGFFDTAESADMEGQNEGDAAATDVDLFDPAAQQQPTRQKNPVKERLKELLLDERLTPSERDAAIYEVTGSSEVSSIASEDLAQQVIAKLEKMLQLATDVEIPF